MPAFQSHTESKSDHLHVKFSGDINEDTIFPQLGVLESPRVVLDLGGVTSINSVGIRLWRQWVDALARSVRFTYVNCPKIIVDQINMVAGFLPENSRVESLLLPLACDKCVREWTIPINVDKDLDVRGSAVHLINPQAAQCSLKFECEAEIDAVTSKYFRFLLTEK